MAKTKSLKRKIETGEVDPKTARILLAEQKLSQMERRGVDPMVLQAEKIKIAVQIKKDMLPHLYDRPWYTWAWDFFQCRNRFAFLTAANQVSKSSTAIRTVIEWAGNPKLWPELWPDDPNPKIFFYCYPSSEVATVEFEKKWLPEFLPRDEMKTHKTYGWHAEYDRGKINSITFNSGVTIYFKTYMQQEINVQTATVHAIFLDEEIPLDGGMFDEFTARLRGTRGYLRMVFTATIGQDLFYRAMERVGMPDEAFPTAWKRSVSLYDSMYYKDGTPSKWTAERIKEEEATCSTDSERLKRIMGRFIKDDGIDFPTFSHATHVIEPFDIPASWQRYAAVDVGGNQSSSASKAAVLFLAVSDDMTKAYVYDCWRGDDAKTTSGDVLNRYLSMKGSTFITQKAYDYGSAEFYEIAVRRGEAFLPAKKERGLGIKRVNELFRCTSLYVMKNGDWSKLVGELLTASTGVARASTKSKKKDDLCDTLRYAVMLVPFDWSKISPEHKDGGHFYLDGHKPHVTKEKSPRQLAAEIAMGKVEPSQQWELEMNAEIDAWNEAYGN